MRIKGNKDMAGKDLGKITSCIFSLNGLVKIVKMCETGYIQKEGMKCKSLDSIKNFECLVGDENSFFLPV